MNPAPEKTSARKYSRIRWIILSRTLVAPFVILMLVCATLVYYFAATLDDRVEAELVRIVDDHRAMINQFLAERTADLRYIADANRFESLRRPDRLKEILSSLQKVSPAFLDVGVFDDKGNHTAYQGPYRLEGKNYREAAWFRAVAEKSVYISEVFLGYRNTPHFIIAVRQMEDGVPWYLRATIDTYFFNNLVENIRMGKTGEAYLINQNGVLQTRKRSGGGLMEPDPDFSIIRPPDGAIVSFSARDHAGDKYRYAVGRLAQTGWLMAARQDFMEASRPLLHAVLVSIALIFAGGAVVVGIAFFLATSVAHRLSMADAEKREMTSQLIMAGKLAEVGEMSSGIAHEINNPLQVMKAEMTMIDDLFKDLKLEDVEGRQIIGMIKDSVNQIGVQIDRCRKITQGLLKFSRKAEPVMRPLRADELIEEAVAMVRHQALLENISIASAVAPEVPPFESDPSQLQQVFLNLLNNAIYAVREIPHPAVSISADMDGEWVRFRVRDNGCGIPEDRLKKIFLPFFTTKPVGQGTGLGLSTCYGIIESLGGRIEVESQVGAGTAFSVYLPTSGTPETHKESEA